MTKIREKSAADDISDIVAQATADLRRIYQPVRDSCEPSVPHNDNTMRSLVAVEGNTIVGVVEYCEKSGSLYLQGLAVHPQWRRKGIAKALIQHVEAVAIREESPRITISTIKETGNAQIFAQLGYRIISETIASGFEGVDGQPVTKVDMCRMLA